MTFKHVKFEDSPTMRALEKVAREKGLVKPETLTKKASLVKKADLTPTDNLMQNVVKLCAGLREQGLVKDAAELETKYLMFKQAQTMYDATGETGEDVVEQAHPEGSHKLVGVDSVEAVVEDILDKHDLIQEVAEKESKGDLPEGKKASALDVIRAVKRALAVDKQELLNQIRAKLVQIRQATGRAMDLAESEVTLTLSFWRSDIEAKTQSPTIDNLQALKKVIGDLTYRLKPGLMVGISEDTWAKVSVSLNRAMGLVNECIDLRKQYNEIAAGEEEHRGDPTAPGSTEGGGKKQEGQQNAVEAVGGEIQQAQQGLNGIAALVRADTTADPQDVKAVNAWIAAIDKGIKDLLANYKGMSVDDARAALAKLTKDFATVRQEWA